MLSIKSTCSLSTCLYIACFWTICQTHYGSFYGSFKLLFLQRIFTQFITLICKQYDLEIFLSISSLIRRHFTLYIYKVVSKITSHAIVVRLPAECRPTGNKMGELAPVLMSSKPGYCPGRPFVFRSPRMGHSLALQIK